jgi:hypothetical protein
MLYVKCEDDLLTESRLDVSKLGAQLHAAIDVEMGFLYFAFGHSILLHPLTMCLV